MTALLLAAALAAPQSGPQDPPGGGGDPSTPRIIPINPDTWGKDGKTDGGTFPVGGETEFGECETCGEEDVVCDSIPYAMQYAIAYKSIKEHVASKPGGCSPTIGCTLTDNNPDGTRRQYFRSRAGYYKRRADPDSDDGWGTFFEDSDDDFRNERFPASTKPEAGHAAIISTCPTPYERDSRCTIGLYSAVQWSVWVRARRLHVLTGPNGSNGGPGTHWESCGEECEDSRLAFLYLSPKIVWGAENFPDWRPYKPNLQDFCAERGPETGPPGTPGPGGVD